MFSKIFIFIKNNILLFPIFIWTLLPAFSHNQILRLFVFISITIFIIKYFRTSSKMLLIKIVFFILITGLIHFYYSDITFTLRHLQLYIFLILIYISSITFFFSNKKKQEITISILIFNLITTIITAINLSNDSNVSRLIAKSNETSVELASNGVGGYGIVYMNVLFVSLYFYILKNKPNRFIKYLTIINFIMSIVLILMANYFIAVLILFCQLLFIFLFRGNWFQFTIRLVTIMLLTLFLYYDLDSLEKVTYKLVENTNLQYKHNDIFNTLKGIDIGGYGTITGRSERYKRSVHYFYKHPLTGTLSFNNLGKHSNILDQFAQFGIFLGFLLINIIFYIPTKLKAFMKFSNKKYLNIFIFSTLIFGLLNNYSVQVGIAYILLSSIIKSKNIKKQKING